MPDIEKTIDDIKAKVATSVHEADARAGAEIAQVEAISQSWLRRNIWGVVAAAMVGAILAFLVG